MTTNSAAAPAPEPTQEPTPDAPRKFGGAQPGSGRKPKKPREKLGQAAQVKLRIREKHDLEARADKAGLSVSGYIRKRLGLPQAD